MGLFGPGRKRLWIVSFHEAGHVVIARHLGATGVHATVGSSGEFNYDDTFSGPRKDEVVMALAGLAAEVLLTGKDNGGSSYDLKRAKRLLRGSGTTMRKAEKRAADLVRRHWADIEAEARRLAKTA